MQGVQAGLEKFSGFWMLERKSRNNGEYAVLVPGPDPGKEGEYGSGSPNDKRNFQRNAGVLLLTDSVKSFIQTEAETTVVSALVFCNPEMEDEISGEMQVGSARMGKEDCGRKGTAKRMSRRSQRRYCKCAPNNLPKSLRMPKNIPMIPHSKRLHSRNRLIIH